MRSKRPTRIAHFAASRRLGDVRVRGHRSVFRHVFSGIPAAGQLRNGDTREWAREVPGMVNFSEVAAKRLGEASIGVDSNYSPYILEETNWSCGAIWGKGDSRYEWFELQMSLAKLACDWVANRKDDWETAVFELGEGLHPMQDWVAHGDFNRYIETPQMSNVWWPFNQLEYAHNWFSDQELDVGSTAVVDRRDYDVVNGPDGRATIGNMRLMKTRSNGDKLYMATFVKGSRRLELTKTMTIGAIQEFQRFVEQRSKSCGKCREHFLLHKTTEQPN